MSSWNIDVFGVHGVLSVYNNQLGTEVGGLSEEIDSTGRGIDMALENVKSPPVETALAGLFEYYANETETMFLKGLSCLKGASDATNAYQNGDHEMALTAQGEAGKIEALDLDGGGDQGGGS